MAGWCTIESDPAVFTEMLQKFGVQNTEVVEIETLDAVRDLPPTYGLIFLFKWKPDGRQIEAMDTPNVYFAKQMVSNACATQALINILLNSQDKVDVGEPLKKFHSFTKDLTAEARGECMGAEDTLRAVHNSFARSQCFSFEQEGESDEDAYHFIAYMPKDGILYELDGLQKGPIVLGDAGEDWMAAAVPKVQERIQQVQALDTKGNGLMFTLLALTADRIPHLEKQLERAEGGAATSDVSAVMQARIESLKEERAAGQKENKRRRHNYIPLAFALLKALSDKNALEPLIAPAVERAKVKVDEKAEKKKQEKAAKAE